MERVVERQIYVRFLEEELYLQT